MSWMECYVGISTETVLQIDNLYTVVKRIFKKKKNKKEIQSRGEFKIKKK